MLYLLDTDFLITYQRRRPRAEGFIDFLAEENGILCTCDVVLTEVYSGLPNEPPQAMHQFLDSLRFLPTSASAARQAGRWRYQFARSGVILQTQDMLIAATAVEHDAVLVTGNIKDYPMKEVNIMQFPRF